MLSRSLACGRAGKAISDEDFHLLDYKVMGLAFSIHRELGRFWNETIYQNELAYRCQNAGFEKVATEVPIRVFYKDFSKFYYEVAFKISSITKGETFYEQDLRRFIRFASLKAMQWINFNHDRIVFKTIFP